MSLYNVLNYVNYLWPIIMQGKYWPTSLAKVCLLQKIYRLLSLLLLGFNFTVIKHITDPPLQIQILSSWYWSTPKVIFTHDKPNYISVNVMLVVLSNLNWLKRTKYSILRQCWWCKSQRVCFNCCLYLEFVICQVVNTTVLMKYLWEEYVMI